MRMETGRSQPTGAFIDDDKLICCGGYMKYQYCDLYDFKQKKWRKLADLKQRSQNSGICTDKTTKNEKERVYVGGGSKGNLHQMQFFDINKNKWFSLPDTNGDHKHHPILWFDDVNVLYTASAWCNIVECMDLRENKWNIHVSPSKDKTFETIFGASVASRNYRIRLCV